MLTIAGLVPLSSVDWPGKLTATVFCQGCPWQCTYCHNPSLIDPRAPGNIDWATVTALLKRRRGLLDGVVFTGGEALRQPGIVPAAAEVKEGGMGVGVHTGGAYPATLARILPFADWVGLDIKALPDDYPQVVGRNGGERAWESLEILLASGTDYEVRTTVYPGSPTSARFPELVDRLATAGVTTFALQEARTAGTPAAFQQEASAWDHAAWADQWEAMAGLATSAFSTVRLRAA